MTELLTHTNTSEPTKLLASLLDESKNDPQLRSPLFRLPRELREQIYHHVLTAVDFSNLDYKSTWPSNRVCTTLLSTCRTIYTEACLLAVSLNPAYGLGDMDFCDNFSGVIALQSRLPKYLAAWQFAALSSLVLHTSQGDLEESPGDLESYATMLLATRRVEGLRLAANPDYSHKIVTRLPKSPVHKEPEEADEDEQFFERRGEYLGWGQYASRDYESGYSRDYDGDQDYVNYRDDDNEQDDDSEQDEDLHRRYLLLPKSSAVSTPASSITEPMYYDASPITKLTIRLDRGDWSFRTNNRELTKPETPPELKTPRERDMPMGVPSINVNWETVNVSPGLELRLRDPGFSLEPEFEYSESEVDRVQTRRATGLALDPSFNPRGDLYRADITHMEQATKEDLERHERGDPPAPYPSESWGRRVMALFPSLRRLTLHLETYPGDKGELDHIVECAKLWTFPVYGGTSIGTGSQGSTITETAINSEKVLSWDGSVVAYRCGMEFGDDDRDLGEKLPLSGFDVRIISFC